MTRLSTSGSFRLDRGLSTAARDWDALSRSALRRWSRMTPDERAKAVRMARFALGRATRRTPAPSAGEEGR